jgi:CHAT domain-containing protein
MKALPGAAYVSFFAHAEWNPEHPERSALRLAEDEHLTAEDFAALDLQGCRMVVLGACESGVPGLRIAADEFRGMPAALLEAGIPGVLATLWPVFTDAADRIIAAFFRHHLGEGLPPAQALRRAQIAFRESRAVANMEAPAMGVRRTETLGTAPAARDLGLPAYWAAFAYIGA